MQNMQNNNETSEYGACKSYMPYNEQKNVENIYHPGYGYFEPIFENSENPIHIHREVRNNTGEVIPHWHNCLEFLYVLHGRPVVAVGNVSFTAEPGMIIMVNTEQIHHLTFKNGVCEYICLQISLDFVKDLGFPTGDNAFPSYRSSPESNTLFNELTDEYFKDNRYRNAALKGIAIRFLLSIYRDYNSADTASSPKKLSPSVTITKNAIKYIKENYATNISTEEVAKATGVSLYHLCRCFKEVTGMTVIHYINFIRCCAAKTMLMKGIYTVSEVAGSCGFSGLSYFTKTYSAFMGCSPSQTLKNGF